MAKSSGVLNVGEMGYDNASKRPHQWLLDGPDSEADLLPIKKHAPEIPTSSLFSGVINSNVPSWGNTFCFQSIPGQLTERLFDTETTRTIDIYDKCAHSINTEKVVGIEEPYSDHSFGLSMSHTLEDPQSAVSYGGIRKVKVSQVKESDNFVSSTNSQNFDRVDNGSMATTNVYRVDENSMCMMGLAFGKEEENIIAESFDRDNSGFISMGQTYSKSGENISMAPYNESYTSDLTFNRVDSNLISMSKTYNHADESDASNCRSNHVESNVLVDSCSKRQSTIISFGGSNDDDANHIGRIRPSYEFLMSQSTPQLSETQSNDATTFSSIDVSMKKEETKVTKKVQSNSFPSNVRSLLSTGMLDGVPVKYIAWSREKELSGVIKGSGYQCGCNSCNSSKVVNAYEFERHAGCKTKHPNNHIYFSNGKTIYGIVQELRNTPQDMLFNVIPTMTGSPINQKSFRLWKESYLAATRELQRIYGKEERKLH